MQKIEKSAFFMRKKGGFKKVDFFAIGMKKIRQK
jgi:hypothetical protein